MKKENTTNVNVNEKEEKTMTKEKSMTKAEKAAAKKAEKAAIAAATVDTIGYLMDTFPSTNMLKVENNQANHGRKICLRQAEGKQLLLAEFWVKGNQIDICAKHTMIDLLSVVLKMTDPIIPLPTPEYHENWAMKYCFRGSYEDMLSLATIIYIFCAYPLSLLPNQSVQTEKREPAKAPAKSGKGKGKGQSKKS